MTEATEVVARDRQLSAGNMLATASARLARAGIDTARLDAEVLLAHSCGTSRSRLLAALREPLPSVVEDRYEEALQRRLRREPVAYIVGRQEFWSLDIEVSRDVLIPRAETELLVDIGVGLLRGRTTARVADVGTGSGCVAIALARELPHVDLWATDNSPAAVTLARANARRLGVADRIRFSVGELLTPVVDGDPFDLICSNPPYVGTDGAEGLPPEIAFEPRQALFAGTDGLAVIRRLLVECHARLASNGCLLVEIGFGQAQAIRVLAGRAGFERVEIRDDYAGIPRVLVASAPPSSGRSNGRGQ
jgi:release factor glutamine methyltransferase